jgi:cupin superfamily acireductone dioxygenase involved in methionine salvage
MVFFELRGLLQMTCNNQNELFSIGNAMKNGTRGWFVGQFMAPSFGLVHQQALEIKWGQHSKGERRQKFSKSLNATTISILVNGSFIIWLKLTDGMREVVLNSPGDYVAFGPGIDHAWEAIEDSLVITIRFPSLKNDQFVL